MRALDRRRLTGWAILVSILALLNYASRAAGGKPPSNVAYDYSTAVSGVIQYGIILGVILAIARPDWRLFALRRPSTVGRAASTALAVFVAVYTVSYLVGLYSNPEKEQGLIPKHWDPHRAGAYVANFVLFVAVAPAVEELMFRGLGYSLLEPLGSTAAILWIGVAFGLAHGLIAGLPILIVFGAGLALLRARTASVYPGMLVHAAFNAIALLTALLA